MLHHDVLNLLLSFDDSFSSKADLLCRRCPQVFDQFQVRFLPTGELTLPLECLFLTRLRKLLSFLDLGQGFLERLDSLMQLFNCAVLAQRHGAGSLDDSALFLRALPLSVFPRRKGAYEPLELDYLFVC